MERSSAQGYVVMQIENQGVIHEERRSIHSLRALFTSVRSVMRFRRLRLPHITGELEDLSKEDINKLKGVAKECDMALLHNELGGVDGIAEKLKTSLKTGIAPAAGSSIAGYSPDQSKKPLDMELTKRRKIFGKNEIHPKRTKFRSILWKTCSSDQSIQIVLICFAIFFIVYDVVLQKKGSIANAVCSGLRNSLSPSPSISPVRAISSHNSSNHDDPFSSHPSWGFAVAIIIVNMISIVASSTAEYKQWKEMGKLAGEEEKHMLARVIRCGNKSSVPRDQLVVGDVVELRSGDVIHADGLIVDGPFLEIKEHIVSNWESAVGTLNNASSAEVSQCPPFLWCNSTVKAGYGLMLVTSVGTDHTHRTSHRTRSPLQASGQSWLTFCNALRWAVALYFLDIILLMYGFLFVMDHHVGKGIDVIENIVRIVYTGLCLVGVLIPDDIFLAVALNFAYSLPRLMDDKVLVRKLETCEDKLGFVTSLCIGKSGVLALNQWAVHWSWMGGVECDELDTGNVQECSSNGVSQDLLHLVFEALALVDNTNIAQEDGATTVEWALLNWGLKKGLQIEEERVKFSVLKMALFQSETKKSWAALSRKRDGKRIVHWKGRADIILSRCSKWISSESGEAEALTRREKWKIDNIIRRVGKKGLTCVALACKDVAAVEDVGQMSSLEHDTNLTLLALVGMRSSCRPGVTEAVETLKAAGVKVRMVTGESLVTAKAIANECGILEADQTQPDQTAENGNIVDGGTFRTWNSRQIREMLPQLTVLADASPSDKVMLVQQLQDSMGEVVALMGDKVEDIPAMEKACVGLSSGISSTQAAKQTSDIIILGDNVFASIPKALAWGRSMRSNLQHFLQFKLSITLAVSVVASTLTGAQLQWIDLIAKLAIPVLIMERPVIFNNQRPITSHAGKVFITFSMWRNVVFQAAYQTLLFQKLIPYTITIYGNTKNACTIIFNTFIFIQIFNVLNARHIEKLNIFEGVIKKPWLICTIVTLLVAQVLASHFLGTFLSTTHMHWGWFLCILCATHSWLCAAFGKFFVRIPATSASTHHNSISINTPLL